MDGGKPNAPQHLLQLDQDNPRTAIHSSDVDALQRAKASTAAAIDMLLAKAAVDVRDLRRLCACGTFGGTLDIANATEIGLLPAVMPNRIELVGDAALAGCEKALLTDEDILSTLSSRIVVINPSSCREYDDHFIEHLRLSAAHREITHAR